MDNVQPMPSNSIFGKLRFSIRSLLVGLVICSILFTLLAFHLSRLRQQAAAADYFGENNSSSLTGSVDFDSFTFDGHTTTEGNAAPKSGSVTVLHPVVKPGKNSKLLGALVGQWFVRRDRIVQIGTDADLDDATLKTNIAKMPWLEQIIVECKISPSATGSKLDFSLSDSQIDQLRESFPNLKITKTGWVNP